MNETPKHRVLVVDDESSIRELMERLLTSRGGYYVSTAINGIDALRQIRNATPDIIISDLNMPQMSGFELLSVVRRRYPEIPVIAVSGAFGSGDQVPGGVVADAFYAKGNQFDELLRIVAELIRTFAERVVSRPVYSPSGARGLAAPGGN